jgi:hypothetical protein
MPQFQIKQIKSFQECEPKHGIYLWIINILNSPPHVGISFNENYFSLKMNGIDDFNIEKVLKIIKKKQIPCVLVKLSENEAYFQRLLSVKNIFDRVKLGVTTCLTPIIQILLNNKLEILLPELLENLTNKQQIESFFGLNLPPNYSGLIAYEKVEVLKHLEKLNNAKRTTHIFKAD